MKSETGDGGLEGHVPKDELGLESLDGTLRGFVEALLAREGHHADMALPESFRLSWHPGLTPAEFYTQSQERLREALAQGAVFIRGCVFCHHCSSNECDHAQPSGIGEVFVGYQATGRPRFEEFLSYLLELEDERAEQAARSGPGLVTRVLGRRRLLGDQLAEYGRGSLKYSIWGQVVFGYIRFGNQKYAITFQVVEGGDRRLRPQIIASRDLLDAMADGKERSLSSLMSVLAQSSRKVESLGFEAQVKTGKKERGELREKVFRILRQLSASLERKVRQRERRTKHAEKRQADKRPVVSGYRDLFQAPTDCFYSDEVKGSLVVVGPSGRVHVYSEAGMHVTSLNLKKAEIERRLMRKRYIPLAHERVTALRDAVGRTKGSAVDDDDRAIAFR